MSEKIVIIGNGFDLRHFLPTKYSHLITILRVIEDFNFGNEVENDFGDIFGTLFKEKEENKEFFEKMNEYYETKNIYFETEKLKSIQKKIKINDWFQYLKSIEDNRIETWIDFETEIERVLKYFVVVFNEFNTFLTKGLKFENGDDDNYLINIDNYKQYGIKNKLTLNILFEFGLLKDYNNYYCTFDEKYIIFLQKELQYFKEKEFFDSIYESLEKFIGIFNDYIIFIVNKFYRHFKEEKKMNFMLQKNRFLFERVNKIYSFNYTNTQEKLYKLKDNQKESLRKLKTIDFESPTNFKGTDFIHGKSIENWNGNVEKLEIVLGINDIDPLLKNHKLFQFTKYFQKLHKNTDYLFLDEKIQKIENGLVFDEFEFYFWGHSLDVSDKEYIEDVFNIVKNTKSRIKIFYHSISGKADQLKNLLNIIDKNIIENMMKRNTLLFIESTSENLFAEL